jgi:hypothetical protein
VKVCFAFAFVERALEGFLDASAKVTFRLLKAGPWSIVRVVVEPMIAGTNIVTDN